MNETETEKTMDILINVANGLYLASYLVRDILCLRLLTVLAMSCLILYFGSRPQPLMEVIYWNLLFLALNLVQVARLLWERYRPGVPASPECHAASTG